MNLLLFLSLEKDEFLRKRDIAFVTPYKCIPSNLIKSLAEYLCFGVCAINTHKSSALNGTRIDTGLRPTTK